VARQAASPTSAGARRGADEVREQHGGQDPIRGAGRRPPGDELLDRVEDVVAAVEPGPVIGAGELDEPRARDPLGHVARALDRQHVAAPVDEQGGHVHGREHVAQVEPRVELEHRDREAGTGRHALEPPPPAQELVVVHALRREQREAHALSPCFAHGVDELVEGRRIEAELIVVRPQRARVRAVEDEPPDAIRMRRRIDRGDRGALRPSEEDRTRAPRG